MLFQQMHDFFSSIYHDFFTLWMVVNVIFPIKVWWVRRWTKRHWKWFQDEHLKVPLWLTLVSLVGGLLTPATPLVFDGMAIGATLYFLNEALYVTFRVSLLGTLFKWLPG